jgi:hypothetical protein
MNPQQFKTKFEPIYDVLKYYNQQTFEPTWFVKGNELNVPYLKLSNIKTEFDIVKQVYGLLDIINFLYYTIDSGKDVHNIISISRGILIDKAKEYSDQTDRLSNFVTAKKYMLPEMTDRPLHVVVANIASKHYAWLEDAINEKIPVTEKGIEEHGCDAINYVFLYAAALEEDNQKEKEIGNISLSAGVMRGLSYSHDISLLAKNK